MTGPLNIPDALPKLARGAHSRNSGKACLMNALSILNGDTFITDTPSNVFYPLAIAAQLVNDTICDHVPSSAELCTSCSHTMWSIGARLLGTAARAESDPLLGLRLGVVAARRSRESDSRTLSGFHARLQSQSLDMAIEMAEARIEGRQLPTLGDTATDAYMAGAGGLARRLYLAALFMSDGETTPVIRYSLQLVPAPERAAAFGAIIDEFDRLTGGGTAHEFTDDDAATVKAGMAPAPARSVALPPAPADSFASYAAGGSHVHVTTFDEAFTWEFNALMTKALDDLVVPASVKTPPQGVLTVTTTSPGWCVPLASSFDWFANGKDAKPFAGYLYEISAA